MIYNLKLILVTLLVLSALSSDIKSCKILNVNIVFFTLCGLIINIFDSGLKGLQDSIIGIIIPLLFLFILFAARMLGAGDIKLFCAIGAIMGRQYILYCMAFSFLAGGLIALTIMLSGKNLISRLKYFINYLKCCFLTTSVLSYSGSTHKNDDTKMRFSYAVAAGTFAYQLFIML